MRRTVGTWFLASAAPLLVAAFALVATTPSTNTGQDCANRLSDPAPLTTPDREWLERCVSAFTLPTSPPATSPPATTSPPGPTPSVTTTPPVPPPTTTPSTTAQPDPIQVCPPFPAFPDAACTGVPAGVTLTPYTGPCTITVANTWIDRKVINCALRPMASGIRITNSRINGSVNGAAGANAPSFTITDSEIVAPQATAVESNGLGQANFVATRVEVTGGNRGVYCRFNCVLRDSWIHGTNIAQTPEIHASAVRQSQGAQILHNRLHCSAQDTPSQGGCSADLTGYGDFEPVANNLIQNNLFVATPGGACAYGGSSGEGGVKPFGSQAHDIRFIDNVFERGPGRKCGFYFPITDFLHDDGSLPPGNQWSGNRWDSGEVLPPSS